jgi:hypothetical protein
MNPEYTFAEVPPRLLSYLERAGSAAQFRRRAVLALAEQKWELICCCVEGFRTQEESPAPIGPRRYPQALLFEDYLTASACREFAAKLNSGRMELSDIVLERTGQGQAQWATEMLPVGNNYMTTAGMASWIQFGQDNRRTHIGPLLSTSNPFYPSVEEAALDWLPFPVYHGASDGRNGQVVFLFPETRAFISRANLSKDGLEVHVNGSQKQSTGLIVKGAYWEGASIRHFESLITNSVGHADVPAGAERLEYYLIDTDGAVFDFHRQDRFSRSGPKAVGNVEQSLPDLVHEALENGEGLSIEFKPFVEPEGRGGASGSNSKLREIIKTAVAFANTAGGCIYLGIDDDCTPVGIQEGLKAWAKADADEATIMRYLNILRGRIKDSIHGDAQVRVMHTLLGDAIIGLIQVSQTKNKPVALDQDAHLYARVGASNRKVPPHQWRRLLGSHDDRHQIGGAV